MSFCRYLLSTVVWLSAPVVLSGCSSLETIVPSLALSGGGTAECDTAVPECAQKRTATLRAMTGDKRHVWVRRPEPLPSYANGTRLFAFRITRPRLSCTNLARGLGELRQAKAGYDGAVADVTREQAKRTQSLIVEVRGELTAEWRRRCRSA